MLTKRECFDATRDAPVRPQLGGGADQRRRSIGSSGVGIIGREEQLSITDKRLRRSVAELLRTPSYDDASDLK